METGLEEYHKRRGYAKVTTDYWELVQFLIVSWDMRYFLIKSLDLRSEKLLKAEKWA